MIDDTVNQIARRVAVHQGIDKAVDDWRSMLAVVSDPASFVLSEALEILSVVALDPTAVEGSWRALAALAQLQLEQAMEARAS